MPRPRRNATSEFISRIEEKYPGSVVAKNARPSRVHSTGAASLDHAIGIGGIPSGRMTELYGAESCGKSTIGLHVCASVQESRGRVFVLETENAFDAPRAESLRVSLARDQFTLVQNTVAEEAYDILRQAVASRLYTLVVLDSLAALCPRAELESGEPALGAFSRITSVGLRNINAEMVKRGHDDEPPAFLIINQTREVIGQRFYGAAPNTPGGKAPKFYASLRIEIRRKGLLKEGNRVDGQVVHAKVWKNKCAPPLREAEFHLMHAGGVDKVFDVCSLASALDLSVTLPNGRKARGFPPLLAAASESPEWFAGLAAQVREASLASLAHLSPDGAAPEVAEDESEEAPE